MNTYTIHTAAWSITVHADSEARALDAYATEVGYRDFNDLCQTLGLDISTARAQLDVTDDG